MAGCTACVLLTLGVLLRAQSPTHLKARLVYVRGAGAEQCPDEEALKNAVAARLGYYPFQTDGSITVVATLDRSQRSSRAHVEFRDEAGKIMGVRELSSTAGDCNSLFDAIAVAISIGLEPLQMPASASASQSATASTPAAVSSPPPPVVSSPPASLSASAVATTLAPSRVETQAPAEHKQDSATPELDLGIAGSWVFGTSPRGTFGLSGHAGVRPGAG